MNNKELKKLSFSLENKYSKDEILEFYLNQIKDPNIDIEDYFKQVINQKVFKINEY